MSDTTDLLIMYARILGLSLDETEEITREVQSAAADFRTASATECVLAASCERDPKILWLGALVYGYMISTCTIKDTEEGDVL